jgi:hypothetical protein
MLDTRLAAYIAASSGGGWSPLALGSSLLAWWDAERSDLITQSGGLVSSWKDIIGAYNVTQGSGSLRPIWSATSFNNRPGIAFDGLDDRLALVGVPAGIPTGADPCEIWALVDQATAGASAGDTCAVSYGNGDDAARALRRTSVSSVNRAMAMIGNGAIHPNSTNNNVDFSGRHVVRAIVGATTTNINVDGVAGSDASIVPATATTRFVIGADANSSASAFWNGVHNTIAVTAPLSAAQASLMYAFLNARK